MSFFLTVPVTFPCELFQLVLSPALKSLSAMGFYFAQKMTMDVCRPDDVGKTPGVAAGQSLARIPKPTITAAFQAAIHAMF